MIDITTDEKKKRPGQHYTRIFGLYICLDLDEGWTAVFLIVVFLFLFFTFFFNTVYP